MKSYKVRYRYGSSRCERIVRAVDPKGAVDVTCDILGTRDFVIIDVEPHEGEEDP